MNLVTRSPGRKERTKYLPFGPEQHKACFYWKLILFLAGNSPVSGQSSSEHRSWVQPCLQSPCKCLHAGVRAATHRHVRSFCWWKCMCTPTWFLQLHICWWVFPQSVIRLGFVYLQAVFMLSNLLRKTEDGEEPVGSDVSTRHKEGETCSQKDLNILSWQTESVLQPVSPFRKWILKLRTQKYG